MPGGLADLGRWVRRVDGVGLVRRVRDWLFAPTGEQPDPEELVELSRFATRLDAELTVNGLELHGIRAELYAADAGGWAPHLGLVQGNRVMVAYGDLQRAAAVLGQLQSDQPGAGSSAG